MPLSQYLGSLGIILLATAVSWLIRPYVQTIDIAMIYLLAVVIVSSRYARMPSLLASIASIALFDFCFVPPYLTFAVSDTNYSLTFGVMLLVAVVVSRLTARIRLQAETGARTGAADGGVVRHEPGTRRRPDGGRRGADLPPARAGKLSGTGGAAAPRRRTANSSPRPSSGTLRLNDKERGVARWVFDHSQMAGRGTSTLPAAEALYLPLVSSGTTVGVFGVQPADERRFHDPIQRQLLETFGDQVAVALQRAILEERNQRAQMEVEAERLRTSLLSSLSHDLRTPLAGIEGAASSLLEQAGHPASTARRHDLAQTILEESRRMTRLVGNLLDMIRVETGSLQVQKEWQPLEEVIGVVLIRLDERLRDHPVTVRLPADLPLVPLDAVLMEQVFINLLDNAIKHTPPGTTSRDQRGGAPRCGPGGRGDDGPACRQGRKSGSSTSSTGLRTSRASGVGLGLTICRGIVSAHGGRIWAENRLEGGTVFRLSLPLSGIPPASAVMEAEGSTLADPAARLGSAFHHPPDRG